MAFPPDFHPEERTIETGPIVAGLALGLLAGLLWELLLIQTDWRLGFSPPVWEIVVGWLGFSAFAAFLLIVVAIAAVAIFGTNTMARNPESWDARQEVFRARRRVAAFVIGLGFVAVFGGVVMWTSAQLGPEFDPYAGFARFTALIGGAAAVAAFFYLKKDLNQPA